MNIKYMKNKLILVSFITGKTLEMQDMNLQGMASLVSYVVEGYTDIMENRSDPRVNDWFLMSNPLPTLVICLTYAYAVKVVGPRLMEKRKPFDLKNTIIVYNFLQVLFSLWLFNESLAAGWFTRYSFRCQPVDYSNDPVAVRTAHGCWWYYISKFTEFFDTIFFVLRKKNNQISKLHVIHHGVMPLSTWFGVKFTPGGHSTFFGMLNTFVHIIMYTYYMLAAFGPGVRKYLWWKRYLTIMQMVQFVLVMLHAFQLLFVQCDYPKAFVWWIGLHAVLFYFLFKEFYDREYKKKQAVKVHSDHSATGADAANGKVVKENGIANGNGTTHPRHRGSKLDTGDFAKMYEVPPSDNGVCSSGYTTSLDDVGAFVDQERKQH